VRALGQVDSKDTAQLAVLVVSGSLGPVTRGHLNMLEQAKVRLESAGYAVCGGFLSPSSYAQALDKAKDRGIPALTSAFRLRLAEIAVRDDELISVASWEANVIGRTVSCSEVVEALERELAGVQPAGRAISVFLVCGSSDRRTSAGLLSSLQQGRVVVPRRGTDTLLETPVQRMFVTDTSPGKLDRLNSVRLREALRSGDTAYVRQVMPAAPARLVLEPTPAERAEFAADLERLSVASASGGPWPLAKIAERLLAEPPRPGGVVAVLVTSGSMSPAHRGHTLLLHRAKARLEAAGYVVPAAWLSPAGDGRAFQKARASGAPELRFAFRRRVAELSVCDDDFISVGSWEAGPKAEVRPWELALSLQEHLRQRLRHSLDGISLKTFYACGGDVAQKQGLRKGFQAQHDLGVVIVPRGDGDEIFMDSPHSLVFCADAVGGEAASRSCAGLCAAIRAGDITAASQAMGAAAARFVLAPTAAERREFFTEFDRLGISLPGPSELAQSRDALRAALKTWADPSGSIGAEDLGRLLRALDPSWTNRDLDDLLSLAADPVDGRVNSDGFVDWLFGLQPAAAA